MRLMMKETKGSSQQLMMKLKQVGYGERLTEAGAGSLSVKGNRIEIQRQTGLASKRGIKEWYENSEEGLEQGFRIEERPGRSESGERLSLKLELSGSLKAEMSESGESVRLKDDKGKEVISYSKLHTYDASGKELVSSMKVNGCELWLEVEDESAEYPIEIDPLFTEVAQVQKLTASDGAASDRFGWSVSIDRDTVVVGTPQDDDDGSKSGSAYIFERNQGGADQWGEAKKLTASDGATDDEFGRSVSISGDTVVVGSFQDDDKGGNSGSVYIFTLECAAPSCELTCPPDITVNATANDNCDGAITPTCSPASGSTFPVGTTTVVCEATDSSNQTGSCSFTVTVEDTEAPQITTGSSPGKLWPPNHGYHTINIADFVTAVSDNCDSGLSINDVIISQVTSDEHDNGPDDGNTTNDMVIAADCKSVNLRAERQETGNGRVYTITFQVTDSAGNTGTATCKVIVSVEKNGGAVDDGPANTVTSNCAVSAAHIQGEPSSPFLPGRRFVPYEIAGLHLRASSCV
jgi:hypothetical protein